MLPSLFSIIKIGIGPSSSHTLGPMKAAKNFCELLLNSKELLEKITSKDTQAKIQVTLLGSLALTGKGHLTDVAVIAGLTGLDPRTSPIDQIHSKYGLVKETKEIQLGDISLGFDIDEDLIFDPTTSGLEHPNTLRFKLISDEKVIFEKEFRSIGGGVLDDEITKADLNNADSSTSSSENLASEPATMTKIIEVCQKNNWSFVDYALEHERVHYNLSKEAVYEKLTDIWITIQGAINRGLSETGTLPGGLELKRRASEMHKNLINNKKLFAQSSKNTLASIYALAVSEENAAGGRIVTTPTCGAAGILPATLKFLSEELSLSDEKICDGILVAGLFGAIVATNGSIAGSEVGCQGEVGVACAMSAASACHLQGGSVKQIEAAAETGLEHHLGLTCDPVMGLVQIPCIERNAAGTIAALNSANMALLGQGEHRVTFDEVVETMMQIGRDMHHKYKETALGGLAKTKLKEFTEGTSHLTIADVDC